MAVGQRIVERVALATQQSIERGCHGPGEQGEQQRQSKAQHQGMQDERARPLVVLMHGDRKVSTKALARQIGAKSVEPCTPEVANRHTGYLVGGTSPFGLRKPMPVYHESTMTDFDRVYLNGGRRGYLVSLASERVTALLGSKPVQCALDK